eukprot:317356-Rhodomonas_salina.2
MPGAASASERRGESSAPCASPVPCTPYLHTPAQYRSYGALDCRLMYGALAHRDTDADTDASTHRQTCRQTDRHTHTHTHIHTHAHTRSHRHRHRRRH